MTMLAGHDPSMLTALLQATRQSMATSREDDTLQGLSEPEAELFVGAVENTITACLAIFRQSLLVFAAGCQSPLRTRRSLTPACLQATSSTLSPLTKMAQCT